MRTMVIAHRGASAIAPENTLSAFRAAHEIGADGFETDVQLTKDGIPVISHDYSIDANSDGKGLIADMTLEELMRYDFGSWKGERFKGERIVTLQECLEIGRTFDVINIELKAPRDKGRPFAVPVADAIASSGYSENIIVSSFQHSLLKEVKESHPEIKVGALTIPQLPGEDELLDSCFPADKPLDSITIDDVTLPTDTAVLDKLCRMDGSDPRAAMLEMGHARGTIFPGMTPKRISEEVRRQADPCRYANEIGFDLDYIHCDYTACLRDPSLIAKLHDLSLGVNVWTPDREDDLRRLVAMGPDGIITNRPDILRRIIGLECNG